MVLELVQPVRKRLFDDNEQGIATRGNEWGYESLCESRLVWMRDGNHLPERCQKMDCNVEHTCTDHHQCKSKVTNK